MSSSSGELGWGETCFRLRAGPLSQQQQLTTEVPVDVLHSACSALAGLQVLLATDSSSKNSRSHLCVAQVCIKGC